MNSENAPAVHDSGPATTSTAEIARAALRHLAQHRMVPTPENYAAAWQQVVHAHDPQTLPLVRHDAMPANVAAEAAEAIRIANRKSRLMGAMTDLIETVCAVVPTLVEDESWVRQQFDAVRKAVHPDQGMPDRGELAHARQLLLSTAAQHQQLLSLRRDSLQGVKGLLAQWLVNMSELSEVSREYGGQLDGYAHQIKSADSIGDLESMLSVIIRETGALNKKLDAKRHDLEESCQRAKELEIKVNDLSERLSTTSTQMMTDHLTALLNRRGLEEEFQRVLGACATQQRPLSLALLDIDDFKRVNDQLGHQAGDETLQRFARLLKTSLRPDDRSARYGGEEFVLLLPGAPMEGAVEMVRRLQRSMAQQAMLDGPSRPQVTFSGGVTEIKDGSLPLALERADEALYEAKRTGKNRVCSR